jgi:hypothetical protein
MNPADVRAIAHRHGVRLLLRFGSSVTGHMHAQSDVTEHCELLYGSPHRLAEFTMYALKGYQDHRRCLDMERAYVDRAIGAIDALGDALRDVPTYLARINEPTSSFQRSRPLSPPPAISSRR